MVLLLFGTGFRGRSGAVRATIGGENAEVLFAGPQGDFVGLDQINVRLPRSLSGRGGVTVTLTVDGKTANSVTIRIGGAPIPQPVPRINSVSPTAAAGQTISSFTIAGENLGAVTAIEFSPSSGITISSLRATATSVTAQVAIARDAAIGTRRVTVASAGGRSNDLAFEIQAAPPSATPAISNGSFQVREDGAAVIAGGRFDFTDADGDIIYTGSLAGSAKLRFSVHLGGFPQGVLCATELSGSALDKAGQNSGTVSFSFTLTGGNRATGNFLVATQLIDAAGNASNPLNFEPGVWRCEVR